MRHSALLVSSALVGLVVACSTSTSDDTKGGAAAESLVPRARDAASAGDAGDAADASDAGDATVSTPLDGAVLYVAVDDGTMDAYQEGTWENVGHWSGLPTTDGVRGVDVDPVSGTLYIAHGATSAAGPGGVLAWNLAAGTTTYSVTYPHGIDQPSYGDGVLYMPSGEATRTTSVTYLIDAATGAEMGSQAASIRPHNTIHRNGHVYSAGMGDTKLAVTGIGTGSIGPSPSPKYGVRPFTVNHDETRAWITWSGYRGFSVGDVKTGKILSSLNFGTNTAGAYDGVSHGISLSPDESEVYVLDEIPNQVRVYDSSDAPTLLATIDLNVHVYPGTETGLGADKSGWLLHSRDGKYVYVGDSGDVIDTSTRTIVTNIATMQNTRHGFLEVDFAQGTVVGTTTHFGLGY